MMFLGSSFFASLGSAFLTIAPFSDRTPLCGDKMAAYTSMHTILSIKPVKELLSLTTEVLRHTLYFPKKAQCASQHQSKKSGK